MNHTEISLEGLVDYPTTDGFDLGFILENKLIPLSNLRKNHREILNIRFGKKLEYKLDEWVYWAPKIEYKDIIKWTIQFHNALRRFNLELKEYITYHDDIRNRQVQYTILVKKNENIT